MKLTSSKELRESRAEKLDQAEAIVTGAQGKTLSRLEQTRFENLMKEANNLQHEIATAEIRESRAADAAVNGGQRVTGTAPDDGITAIGRHIRAKVFEAMDAPMPEPLRALSGTSVFQDPNVQASIVDSLISAFPYTSLGAQFAGRGNLARSDANNFIRLPKQTGLPTMNALGTGVSTLSADSGLTIGHTDLDHYTVASSIVKVDYPTMQDSIINLDAFIGRALVNAFANSIAQWVIDGATGDGIANGILNTSGIQTVTASGTSLPTIGVFDDLVTCIRKVLDQNVPLERVGMVASPAFREEMNKSLATDNQPLTMPEMLASIRKAYTTGSKYTFGAGSNEFRPVFGDWSNLVISLKGPITIKLEQRFMDDLQFGFILYARIGWGFIRPAEFCVLNGLQIPSLT